jgi:hypothetical protein
MFPMSRVGLGAARNFNGGSEEANVRIKPAFFACSIALGLLASASSAATVRVNVAGEDWDVTTGFGTLLQSQSILELQTWYNDYNRAQLFAAAVGEAFGYPNISEYTFDLSESPYFVALFEEPSINQSGYYTMASCISLLPFATGCDVGGRRIFVGEGLTVNAVTFATATRVSAIPLPAGGILLMTGLAAAVVSGKRRRKIAPQLQSN